MVGCDQNDAADSSPQASVQTPTTDKANAPQAVTSPWSMSFLAMDQRVPVIMYHDIREERGPGSVWFDCTRAEFEDQMKTIRDRGYQPVSLDDLHKHLTEGARLPNKAIVLTFDDNYQGFYDIAWPMLKEANYPAAIFVHTGYVGDRKHRPHMTWDTLLSLSKSPLITIASHTVHHPDLTTLSSDQIAQEMTDSKAALEEHIGKPVVYFAYPDGRNNEQCQAAAQEAGYMMSFSIQNGPAEESPNMECINRYIQTRLDKAMDDCERAQLGVVGVYSGPIKTGPVAYKEVDMDGKNLSIVTGGNARTSVSTARESVSDFISRTGAVAGINGTFFDMAAIQSTDNKLVGPCKTPDDDALIPDAESWRWPKVKDRPLIMWGPTMAAIVPYNPAIMNDDQAFKNFMPDVTNVFLAGAWLVHGGVALSRDQILIYGSSDAEDPRRRAAFGFLPDGSPVAAAAKDSVPSSTFAEMLVHAGVQEAVLLDSGFSTSLVYNNKIMASGHSTLTEPSRPVPHAIVFMGDLDPASQAVADAAIPATSPTAEPRLATVRRRHRRHRRRRHSEAPAPDVPGASAPTTAGPPPPP
jgi:peptidoglycan/xylan/chitin deacetylase (PgdA/CDA1 family)